MKKLFFIISFLCACFTSSDYAMEKIDPVMLHAYTLHVTLELPKNVAKKILYYTLPQLTNQETNEFLRTIKIPYNVIANTPTGFDRVSYTNDGSLCISKVDFTPIPPQITETLQYNATTNQWQARKPLIYGETKLTESSWENTKAFISEKMHGAHMAYTLPIRYQEQFTAFHPTDTLIAFSYHPENVITLLDFDNNAEINTLQTKGIIPFAFSPNGQQIACVQKNKTHESYTIHISDLRYFTMARNILKQQAETVDLLTFEQYLDLHKHIVSWVANNNQQNIDQVN